MNPLISCIMPTRERRKFIPAAIDCFLAQTYPNKELIIIDDGPDRVSDLIPPGGLIRYYHIQERRSVGEKRNIAINAAAGDYIAHFDDDDWSHPSRLKEQIKLLIGAQTSIVGYRSMYFLDETNKRAFVYMNDEELYALGTSLLYSRAYWKGGKFPDKYVSEDNDFISRAQRSRGLVVADANDRMVARIHSGNTSDKSIYGPPMWTAADFAFVRGLVKEKHALSNGARFRG